jgi:D-lyxose ketol-isomerase
MIWFTNLPKMAEIRIFTLAGDLVDVLQHDSPTYAGADIENIDQYKSPTFGGGEHAWDLITQHDQALASGLYLFTVENQDEKSSSFGKIKEGKFLIIK